MDNTKHSSFKFIGGYAKHFNSKIARKFQQRLILAGFEPVTDSGPEQTAKFIQEELVRWTPLLKASGLKIN